MKEEDKEEYPGEFKDSIIKIIVLLPAIFCGILYVFMVISWTSVA